MTVVVAFVGSDCAVMASDSEASELMGYTGSSAVKQPLEVALRKEVDRAFGDATHIDRWECRAALRRGTASVLKDAYDGFVAPDPRLTARDVLDGSSLVLGRDTAGYWLLEIDGMNGATFYERAGFHTIGRGSSAAYFAQSLLKHYDMRARTLGPVKLAAYRTVDACIHTLGGKLGVGGNVQLWSSEAVAQFTKADDEELERLASAVAQWSTMEAEAFDQVVLPATAAVEQAEMPDTLSDPGTFSASE
jgi:hypothetical protein